MSIPDLPAALINLGYAGAIAGLPAGRIPPLAAAGALTVPVLLNMLAKAGLTLGFAGRRGGYRPALWLGAGAVLSGATLVALV